MAEKKSRTGASDQEFEKLKTDLKNGTTQRVYVFYGEETYLRQQYVEMLRKLLVPSGFEEFNYHRLNGVGLTVQELTEAVEAMPMMAQATLVTVTDMNLFGLEEAQRSAVIELLSDFPDYCTLVFIYDEIPYKRDGKMKKLTAALDRFVHEVAFCQQNQQQLYRWISKHFQAVGHEIDPTVAEHLTFTCGTLMTGLASEIEKIGAYAKHKNITVADIDAVADPVLDARIFDMTNQITAGKFDAAAKVLGDLLQAQEEPIMIVGAIGKELRRLYTARLALDHGKDRFWLMKTWGMSDYPAKLLIGAAQKVNHEWCSDAVRRCQVLDRRMKSETGMDRENELKLFLMTLAQK